MNIIKKALYLTAASGVLAFTGCATIVNDPYIPLAFTFVDGSAGKCDFSNKRGTWSSEMPATNVMIRRSDDDLVYNCTTEDGREATGSVQSKREGGKTAASIIFFDFGITDAITDKHRTYQSDVIIPVTPKESEGSDEPQVQETQVAEETQNQDIQESQESEEAE